MRDELAGSYGPIEAGNFAARKTRCVGAVLGAFLAAWKATYLVFPHVSCNKKR